MLFKDYVKSFGKQMAAPLAGFPATKLTNTTVKENLNDGKLQAKTILELNKEVDFDIVFPMMDLTVETEALGGTVDWETDEMPAIKGIKVETLEDAKALVVPEIGVNNRLNIFVETCKELRNALPEKIIWGYVLGPFSIAGRLMGMTEISIAVKLEPETVHEVLEKATQLLEKYTDALLDTGIDGIMILEPASSLLREDDAQEFSNNYIKRIVNIIKAKGKTPSLHNCGTINHLVKSMCDTGIEALSIGSAVDAEEIYSLVPDNVVMMGNIDPATTMMKGSYDDVKKVADSLIEKLSCDGRFIISSGCDLPPSVPIDNLKAIKDSASASCQSCQNVHSECCSC
ncbi:MAG: uroporphyrinogen decarboxylase family protein [Armatimonadota bacterium]